MSKFQYNDPEGVFDITGVHGSGELRADDKLEIIAQNSRWIAPAPDHHSKIREICLPPLIDVLGG